MPLLQNGIVSERVQSGSDKTGKPGLEEKTKLRGHDEPMTRPRERFGAAWRRVMLGLNVFFCSCLNLGFLVSDLL